MTQHNDDISVDRFAEAMKAKLAEKRGEGYGGWDDPEQCHVDDLAQMLVNHIAKGDPVDIANFCMMMHQRRAPEGSIQDAMIRHLCERLEL